MKKSNQDRADEARAEGQKWPEGSTEQRAAEAEAKHWEEQAQGSVLGEVTNGTALVDAKNGCPGCPHEDWSHLVEADVEAMCASCRAHWKTL